MTLYLLEKVGSRKFGFIVYGADILPSAAWESVPVNPYYFPHLESSIFACCMLPCVSFLLQLKDIN